MPDSTSSLDWFKSQLPKRDATREQEAELSRRIQAGDESAVWELVELHLRFCLWVSGGYAAKYKNVPAEDFNAAAIQGAVRAARSYDWTRGARFISYAISWVRQACQKEAANMAAPVRVPVALNQGLARASRYYARPENCEKRVNPAHSAEIAAETGTRKNYVDAAMVHLVHHRYLDAPAHRDQGDNPASETTHKDRLVADSPLPDHGLEVESCRAMLEELVAALPARQRLIIQMHFLADPDDRLDLKEIGVILGCTRERVRQLKEQALSMLRDSFPACEIGAELLN